MFLFSLRFTEVYWVVYLRGKGFSFAGIGLLETVFHIASFSSEIPTGIIADRFGRRVSLSVGRALAAVSAALTLYARNWSLLAASFAVSAISYTCHSGAFDALVYDSLPEDRRTDFTRLMGKLNSTYLAGTALAGALAALLARASLDWLYRAVVAVDIVAAVVALTLPEDSPSRVPRKDGIPGSADGSFVSDLKALYTSLRQPDLRNLLLLWGIAGALGTSVIFYGQSVLKESLLPLYMVGLAGTAGNLLAILPTSSAHKLQKRFGQKAPVVAGSFALPALVVALGLVPGAAGWLPRAGAVALYVAIPIVQETLYPLFSDAVNARTVSLNRAAVLSSGGMMFSLSMMVTFPLIGYLGDHLGLRLGLVAGALLTAICITPVALALSTRRPSVAKDASS